MHIYNFGQLFQASERNKSLRKVFRFQVEREMDEEMMVEWKVVDALILGLVSGQALEQGGRGRRAREEEAWLRRRERFDGMMAKERDKVARRRLTKALEEVEEEMDSIMEQMFGGKLKGKSDLGISSKNCTAKGLSHVQDSLEGGKKKCEVQVDRLQGLLGGVEGGGTKAIPTTARLEELKATAHRGKMGTARELQRRNYSRNKGA